MIHIPQTAILHDSNETEIYCMIKLFKENFQEPVEGDYMREDIYFIM